MGELVRTGSRYTDEERRRAVLEYAIYGLMTKVSKSTGIPLTTLCDWRKTDWWETISVQVRTEKEDHILAQQTAIIEKSNEVVRDRLENGDYKLVKVRQVTDEGITEDYEHRRVPVSAKDAALVGGISFDKTRLILNQPTTIRADTRENLDALAEKFAQLADENRDRVVSEQ